MKYLKPGATFAVAVLLATVLSGCADKGGGEPNEPEPALDGLDVTATKDTGAIRGVVVDAAIRPLANATVELLITGGDPRTTTTNLGGAFGFSEVPPGSYFLRATKAGYSPAQVNVDVEAGVSRPKPVNIQLQADPSTAPYLQEFAFKGFIECSTALSIVLFAACGLLPDDVNNNRFLFEFELDRPADFLQAEMLWDSTQALGDRLVQSYTCLDCGEGGTQVGYGRAEGESPLVMVANTTLAQEIGIGQGKQVTWRVFASDREETDVIDDDTVHGTYGGATGEECFKWPVLFDACMGFGGFGAVVQQEYEVFNHAFYHFTPPEGWQFSVDGVPSP